MDSNGNQGGKRKKMEEGVGEAKKKTEKKGGQGKWWQERHTVDKGGWDVAKEGGGRRVGDGRKAS